MVIRVYHNTNIIKVASPSESYMEVCVDCIESAVEASVGGASRLELCSALKVGGLTPTSGLLRMVKKVVDIPVFVMLRNREGDFMYTEMELEVIKDDAVDLRANGADGFVFGALNPDGSVDTKACEFILTVCKPLPVTFHRAFDMSRDLNESLQTIISLGFTRVLTSGGKPNAFEGSKTIKKLINCFSEEIVIMPGGGITASNLESILTDTAARDFHASARIGVPSRMHHTNPLVSMSALPSEEYTRKICCRDVVSSMLEIYRKLYN